MHQACYWLIIDLINDCVQCLFFMVLLFLLSWLRVELVLRDFGLGPERVPIIYIFKCIFKNDTYKKFCCTWFNYWYLRSASGQKSISLTGPTDLESPTATSFPISSYLKPFLPPYILSNRLFLSDCLIKTIKEASSSPVLTIMFHTHSLRGFRVRITSVQLVYFVIMSLSSFPALNFNFTAFRRH